MTRTPSSPLARFTARLTAGGVTAGVALAAFGLLLVLVQARWGPLHRLDIRVANGLNSNLANHRGEATGWRTVSNVLQPLVFQVLAVGIAVVLWRAGLRRIAVFTVVTVLGAGLLSNVTKAVVTRARPKVDVALVHAHGSSFPSGHALTSFVALGLLVVLTWPRLPRRWAVTLTAGAALAVIGVGFSRLALGAHYVSDVLGAWLLGGAWLLVMIAAFRIARQAERPEISAPTRR